MALLLAEGGDGLRFEGSVAAGGGYDASLLVAPGSGATGSAVATAAASGGAAIDLGDEANLYLGARLDGAATPGIEGLDRGGAGVEASLGWDALGPVGLVLTPSATWNWYADPARSGGSLSVRLTLRVKPLGWLTVRAGYAHQLATAADPVFGYDLDRVFGGVEFRVGRGTWLALTGSGERGDQTFYRASVPPAGAATPVSHATVGSTPIVAGPIPVPSEPYRAVATTLGATVGLEQDLGSGLSADVCLAWRRIETPEGPYQGPSVFGAVVWRVE
jgi:hypothetical protein